MPRIAEPITTIIQDFFEDLGRALTAGNTRAIAAMWGIPALVMHDDGIRAVNSTKEVEDFFEGAKAQYNARGIMSTRPEIQRVEWISARLVNVEVRWPNLDAEGHAHGYETSSYILRLDDNESMKIHAVIMHGTAGMSEN